MLLLALLLLPVNLAQTPAFPEGTGRAIFEQTCNFCHPATFVLDKAFTRAEWQAKVTEMLQEEDVPAQERDAIVFYLAKAFPKRINVNQATAKELQAVLEISEAGAAAVVASRQAKGLIRSIGDLRDVLGREAAKLNGVENRVEF